MRFSAYCSPTPPAGHRELTREVTMTSIQPEPWADRAAQAVVFYQAAFGALVLHQVGECEDIVAQRA
jgi:hypothetical protein